MFGGGWLDFCLFVFVVGDFVILFWFVLFLIK